MLQEGRLVSKPEPRKHKSTTTPTPPAKPASRVPSELPAVLLEGDELTSEHLEAAGARGGPSASADLSLPSEPDLPTTAGAGTLRLTPRDPRCLYANWDFTAEQQRRFNRLSVDSHLILRLHVGGEGGKNPLDLHVQPESTHWFIPLEQAGGRYQAELGYYRPGREWVKVATSGVVEVALETPAQPIAVQFATLSLEALPEARVGVSGGGSPSVVRAAAPEMAPIPAAVYGVPSTQALPLIGVSEEAPGPAREEASLQPPPAVGPTRWQTPAVPAIWSGGRLRPAPVPAWSPAQEQAMSLLIASAFVREESIGSIEIAEWVAALNRGEADRRGLAGPAEWEAGEVPEGFPGLGGGWGDVISSPAGGEVIGRQGFWFQVNAELVVYGSTEPDAVVTIGGRRIRLRPDGSFSYRYALPDGDYRLPVVAKSVHGEVRTVDLKFRRETARVGHVGTHPQDPTLKEPAAENLG